jgi:uncharacterized protein
MQMTELVHMPLGQKLWDVVPDDLEAKLRAHPLVAMVPPEFIEGLQPWVVTSLIGKSVCEAKRAATNFTLDQSLVFQAQLSNVPVLGLETISEQLHVFADFSIEDEVKMMLDALSPQVPHEDVLATLINLYQQRRVTVALLLARKYGNSAGLGHLNERFTTALLGKRNVNMAKRAAPLIDKGQAFIAVGALHLAGDDGVVELLRKAGYQVTAAE